MSFRVLCTAVAAALTSLAWTAGAVAGNPHGTPPGQQKASASTSTSTNASANVTAGAKVHGQGQAKGHAKVHGAAKAKGHAAASVKASGRANGHGHAKARGSVHAGTTVTAQTQAGIAPSNATSHNTVAAASSNQTKLYGNGTTASQVATQAGFGSAMLVGPGNSQPHKVSCGTQSIDVHALKAHASAGACGGTASASARLHGHGHVGVGVSAKLSAAFAAAVGLGVKPFAITAHNTVAAASSSQTKLYGNGTTAGQIAAQAGFGAAMLFGPGNSQPHKVSCGTHNIDVHALKANAGACASAAIASSPAVSAQATVATSVAQQQAAAAAAAKPSTSTGTNTGVLGAAVGAHAKQSSSGSGVLGARTKLASATTPVSRATLAPAGGGTLPFTGFGLWLPVVLGLGLIACGYGLVRKGNAVS